ncbi:MAG TPA: sugar ABC transporter permease [Ktedonobacteraceae bacterium]|nr:sugar ABC transporter permease [Ktedonobacteraceae bacterium]
MSIETEVAAAETDPTGDAATPVPRLRRRNRIEIWLFLLPALLFQLIWGWYPVVMAFVVSFTDAQPILPSTFTGLESYLRVWQDPLVHQAFQVTFIYAILSIGLTFILPLLVAIFLIELPPRAMRWMMILWFLPISNIANTILWRYIYNNQYGLMEFLATNFLHLSHQQFLDDPNQVLFWLVFPTIVVIGPGVAGLAYMAALQGLPRSYFEAAEIEGASFWRKIWTISIPRLRPIIAVLLIYGIIQGLQTYDWPALMTGGQPEGASRTIVLYMYSLITNQRYADATALGIFLFLVTFIIIVLFRIFFREDPDA